MTEVVIVDGVRTPYCKAGTLLTAVSAVDLGRIAVVELLARTSLDPDVVDEVIVGNIAQPPEAVNIARVIALRAGLPERVPAYTVARNCGSGLQAIADACLRIVAGQAETVIAGGVESMSNIPFFFPREGQARVTEVVTGRSALAKLRAASKLRPQHFKPVVGLEVGLTDAVCGLNMGETAELLAKELHVSREEQDAFALRSHQRATAARGALADEIVFVPVPPGYQTMATQDNGIREHQTLDALAKLRPYFDRRFGSVTAGNASQITDGGAAVLVMAAPKAAALGYRPLGKVRAFAFAGVDPARMGLGPAVATPLALQKAGVAWHDIELCEINEAFAAQVLANARLWPNAVGGELDWDRTNVNGGAIALGHPVGSSGTRLVLTLLKEMRRRGAGLGLATLCIGGGQGGAMVLEAL